MSWMHVIKGFSLNASNFLFTRTPTHNTYISRVRLKAYSNENRYIFPRVEIVFNFMFLSISLLWFCVIIDSAKTAAKHFDEIFMSQMYRQRHRSYCTNMEFFPFTFVANSASAVNKWYVKKNLYHHGNHVECCTKIVGCWQAERRKDLKKNLSKFIHVDKITHFWSSIQNVTMFTMQ